MATLVTHQEKGGTYVLLGSGFGAFRTSRPSAFFGSLAPTEGGREMPVVLICDHAGKVGWVNSADIEVVTIDGLTPADILQTNSKEHDS